MTELAVEFDFERYVKSVNDARPKRKINPLDTKAHTVVCIHWLQGLCQKMENCEFLHKLDKSKMPLCKHGSQCRKKNCPKKHESDEEKEECPFFLQGFCMHGPFCKYKHIKRPPDECPDEVDFLELMNSNKKRKASAPNLSYKISICKHWLEGSTCPFGDGCIFAHGEVDLKSASFHDDISDADIYDPVGTQMGPAIDSPKYTASNSAFFVLQAPDLVSLARAMKRGVWSANASTVRELSVAMEKAEHVLLFFSVGPLYAIYAMAELDPRGVPIPPPDSPSSLSVHFPVRWVRSFRLSVRTTFQLRLSQGMHLGKLENDGRLEPTVGAELFLMASRKPEWDWSAELVRAQNGGHNSIPMGELQAVAAQLREESPDADVSTLPPLFKKSWIDRMARSTMVGGLMHSAPHFARGLSHTQGPPRGPPIHVPSHAPHAPIAPPAPGGGGGDYYPGVQPGFVVGCTPDILDECFQRRLFGLPIQLQGDAIQYIQPGTPLFLQDVNTNLLHGLFEAVSPAMLNMEPQAFTRGGALPESMYPVQVRFHPVLQAPVLQEMDPEVMSIFSGKRSVQRIGPISLAQTKRLSNIFAFRAGAWAPTVLPQHPPAPAAMHAPPGPRGPHGPPGVFGPAGGRDGPPSSMYRPPFRCVETVLVDIPFTDNGYMVKSRIVGIKGGNILNLISSLGASQSNLKIRLRGKGSGYREGLEQMELQEPMQFCVSADNEDLLQRAVGRLRELIEGVRQELQRRF